jgi:hypothetical protein
VRVPFAVFFVLVKVVDFPDLLILTPFFEVNDFAMGSKRNR